MIRQTDEQGMTVEGLYDVLSCAIAEGYGQRRLLIGPLTDLEPGSEFPITGGTPVTGVEINDGYETEICWLYPGEQER